MTQSFDIDTLANRGFAVAPGLIGPDQCRALAALWPEKARFRSHVIMQRHGYGQGEYQYFTYPLPKPVEALRQALYPELAAIANRWNEQLGLSKRFLLFHQLTFIEGAALPGFRQCKA